MNRLLHDHPPERICEGVCFIVDAVGRGGKIWGCAWQLSRKAGRAIISGRELVGGRRMHYDGYFVHGGWDCRRTRFGEDEKGGLPCKKVLAGKRGMRG